MLLGALALILWFLPNVASIDPTRNIILLWLKSPEKNSLFDEIKSQFGRYLGQSEHSPLTIKSYMCDIGGFAKWFQQTSGDVVVPELITPTDL